MPVLRLLARRPVKLRRLITEEAFAPRNVDCDHPVDPAQRDHEIAPINSCGVFC
jgi:hypothetical protein